MMKMIMMKSLSVDVLQTFEIAEKVDSWSPGSAGWVWKNEGANDAIDLQLLVGGSERQKKPDILIGEY